MAVLRPASALPRMLPRMLPLLFILLSGIPRGRSEGQSWSSVNLGVKGGGRQELEVLQNQGGLWVTQGETLHLNCTLIGASPAGGVRWYKGLDTGQPPVYDDKTAPPSSRVARVVPGSNTDYSIRISNIQPEDAGTYYCVKYKTGSLGTEYKSGKGTEVSVIGPPARPSQPIIRGPPGRVDSGARATFNCEVRGFHSKDITVTWTKNGNQIQAPSPPIISEETPDTSYRITSTVEVPLTKEDIHSTLSCHIHYSSLEKPLVQSLSLKDVLRVAPQVSVETNLSSPIPLNTSVKVTCKVDQFYPNDLSVTWWKDASGNFPQGTDSRQPNPDGTFSFSRSFIVSRIGKSKIDYTCKVIHNSQSPVYVNRTLKFGLQPEDENLCFIELGAFLLSNPGLWIGLILGKIVTALFFLYLLRRNAELTHKERGLAKCSSEGFFVPGVGAASPQTRNG